MNVRAITAAAILTLASLALLSACSAPVQQASAAPNAAAATETPAPTATPEALLTVKVVTYNILFGGGRDRSLDWHNAEEWRGMDRTPLIREYLKQVAADIIGLQEATGWDTGEPPYIKTVADELGMNYVVVPDHGWGLDAALMTRYPVLESEDLSNKVNSMLRARLQGPDGQPINVFVAHLNSDSTNDRACGTELLLRKMQPYLPQRTFLIGDMNFFGKTNDEWPPSGLRAGGWKMVAVDSHWGLDQIWVPAAMDWGAVKWPEAITGELNKMSDHRPLALQMEIYSPSGALLAEQAPQSDMPEVTGLPQAVLNDIGDVRVAFAAPKEDGLCRQQTWAEHWSASFLSDGSMHVSGFPDWQAGANWSKQITANQGMLLDFNYKPKSEFNIFMDNSTWAAPDYRRFGVYLPLAADAFQSDIWQGETGLGGEAWQGLPAPKPDTWYRLLLVVKDNGSFAGYMWGVDDPARVAVYRREMGADWAGLEWRLAVGGNRGYVDLRDVRQLVFQPVE